LQLIQLIFSQLVFVFACLVVIFTFEVGYAGDSRVVLETRHTIITFNSEDDLASFNDAINYAETNSLASIFSSETAADIRSDLKRKVDLLFEKVQLILDMRKEMKPVRVRVYSNAEELDEAYFKIYKTKNTVRGWYVYDFNTVFLNVEDVHEGMLAHELGHAVIDHFLAARPPRATAEILAKYVDENLHAEVKR